MAELATIARPYAEALFRAVPQGEATGWAAQVAALGAVAADPALRQFADSPKVASQQVFDLVAGAVQQALVPGVQNLLRTMIENGRLAALPEVAAQFHARVNASSGVSDAIVYSAYPIEPAALAELAVTLEKRFGRKLAATVQLEPELIGGVRVVVGDEVLDTSVKARLEHMKAALTA